MLNETDPMELMRENLRLHRDIAELRLSLVQANTQHKALCAIAASANERHAAMMQQLREVTHAG